MPSSTPLLFTASLPAGLRDWLERHADGLDTGRHDPAELLPMLAEAGVFRWGVPESRGGLAGTDAGHAIEISAELSSHSMAASFVAWGQRVFIDYLLHTPNAALADRLLPDLLTGRLAGATALSNVMKFLSGIESLQIAARSDGVNWRLDGVMPWVTNLRPQGFVVAAAVAMPDGATAIAALPHDALGLQRSADLPLLALQSTNTAAIRLADTPVGPRDLLHANAQAYLPGLRPVFVGLQCGMTIGLARRSLREARQAGKGRAARGILAEPLDVLEREVERLADDLLAGVRDGSLVERPMALFELRIGLAEAAAQAVQLELQAAGGAAYLYDKQPGFARRWRESAFVPIVTPSLVQLRTEIAKKRAQAVPRGDHRGTVA